MKTKIPNAALADPAVLMAHLMNAPQSFVVPAEEVMAIDPSAIGKAFFPGFFGSEKPAFEKAGSAGIVSVSGPLMQKAGWFWDGYDDIKSRFAKAMSDTSVKAVVLKLDSPGGMVAGLFEAVDAMMAMKRQSQKRVFAYADEMAASAAYALASVADEIWLPKSGVVGSVGTVITLAEESARLAKEGVRVVVITTGTQKADGHPALALSDEVIARFAARATYLNGMFVGQVAASRGLTTEQVLGLQAGVFYGPDAVNAKLANGVSSFDEFLSMVDSKTKVSPPRAAVAANVAAEGRKMEDDKGTTTPAASIASLTLMAATLGMVAASSERDVQARVRELADAERDLLRTTGKATIAEALGTMKAWQLSHESLPAITGQLKALQDEGRSRDLDALIEGAKATGKITSDVLEKTCREIGASSLPQLRSLIETLPAVGGGTVRQQASAEPAASPMLTAEDREVCRMLGISHEQMIEQRREEHARKAG